MNLNFLKIKKNFQKKKSEIDPSIFWKYTLYSTFVLILGAFILGAFIFIRTNKDFNIFVEEQSNKAGINKKQRLEKILEDFYAKEKKSKDILNSSEAIIDPSL